MTTISIAMATYNGERYIRQQLDSLARQTALPCELVVTDDGSTDCTLSIVENFALNAPFPVRVYRNTQRLNYAKNFLYAASLCKGDWIAFCDQDDVWLDHKLAIVSDRIVRYPDALLIVHSVFVTDEKLAPTGRVIPKYPYDNVLPPLHRSRCQAWGHAMIFKADVLSLSNVVRYPTDHYNDVGLVHSGIEHHKLFGHDRYISILANIFGNTVEIADCLVRHRRYPHYDDSQHNWFERIVSRFKTLKTWKKVETLLWHRFWKEWSDILQNATFREAALATRAQEAATMYGGMAILFAVRTKLYETSRVQRIKGMVKMIKLSGYRTRNRGGFGMRGFISDIIKLVI
jgi:glycosyltransferase involved in cell wall biosynthesis